MKLIVLFTLVCVAFAQPLASELEQEIETALGHLELMGKAATIIVENVLDIYENTIALLNSRASNFIHTQMEFQNAAIAHTKNVSDVLTKKAQNDKLPQDVIKCISKEEQATIASIKEYFSKFEADLKRTQANHVTALNTLAKGVNKTLQSLPARYKQASADIKNCKDIPTLRKVLAKIDDEYITTMLEMHEIEDHIQMNEHNFERDAKVLTINNNYAITLARDLGERAMRDCMPKTA